MASIDRDLTQGSVFPTQQAARGPRQISLARQK